MKDEILPLPEAIAGYFAAANDGESDEACAHFAPDAVVQDEGKEHRGLSAIRSWIEHATEKYHPVAAPLRLEEKDGRHSVAAQVSGAFPGSPVELNFAFTLQNQKIVNLEIS